MRPAWHAAKPDKSGNYSHQTCTRAVTFFFLMGGVQASLPVQADALAPDSWFSTDKDMRSEIDDIIGNMVISKIDKKSVTRWFAAAKTLLKFGDHAIEPLVEAGKKQLSSNPPPRSLSE